MAQHDYNIANAPGATVRADVNALAEAIASLNAGNSAPSVTFAYMLWADTTNALLKMRNPANSGWITLASISGSTFRFEDSVFAAPASTDWFGTTNRIPRIGTTGVMEVGGTIDFHPDASGSEDYRLRIARATGANGAATITNSGTGGLNVIPGSGGFKVDSQILTGRNIGDYVIVSGSTLPPLCVWANGQNLNRTTYAAYFASVGTTYGAGDGSTTFGTPDVRGRVIAGKDDMGGSAANRLTGLSGGVNGAVLGAAGGAQTHVLTIAQLAAHKHTKTGTGRYGANRQTYSSWQPSAGDSDWQTQTLETDNAGSDEAHNNVQPTIIGNVAIYVGV